MRTALHRFQISVFDNKIYYMTDCICSFTKLLRPWSHGSRDRATPWKSLEKPSEKCISPNCWWVVAGGCWLTEGEISRKEVATPKTYLLLLWSIAESLSACMVKMGLRASSHQLTTELWFNRNNFYFEGEIPLFLFCI